MNLLKRRTFHKEYLFAKKLCLLRNKKPENEQFSEGLLGEFNTQNGLFYCPHSIGFWRCFFFKIATNFATALITATRKISSLNLRLFLKMFGDVRQLKLLCLLKNCHSTIHAGQNTLFWKRRKIIVTGWLFSIKILAFWKIFEILIALFFTQKCFYRSTYLIDKLHAKLWLPKKQL